MGYLLRSLEHGLESVIFNSRWLLAPFYLGLIGALALLLVEFGHQFIKLFIKIMSGGYDNKYDVILGSLTLIDLSLVANLLLIVIFSGYENFVSKIDVADHKDRPDWMGKVDYAGLKIKLIASIVAISGIELLKTFLEIKENNINHSQLAWQVGIHMTFVVSGVLLALMDKIAESGHGHNTSVTTSSADNEAHSN